jgi:uncharacterized protein (DUF983 family)
VIKRCPHCEGKVYLEALGKENSCPDCGVALRLEGYDTTMALALVVPGTVSMISILFMGPGASLILMAVSAVATVTIGCRYIVKVRVAEPEIHRG